MSIFTHDSEVEVILKRNKDDNCPIGREVHAYGNRSVPSVGINAV